MSVTSPIDTRTLTRCDRCVGTGSLESSDSTDDSYWDCPRCEGTGRVPIMPPPGWQYGVIIARTGKVWACGDGPEGQSRQRTRLRYPTVAGPILLPLHLEDVA